MNETSTLRVLVTESDPPVRQWLGRRAEELGVRLRFADGGELLDAIGDETPDCVVLDAYSSRGDPSPMWRQLREGPATRHIPVLVYSSSNRWQRVAELAGESVDGYIPRPFTLETMLCAA